MSMTIRRATKEDAPALSRICLLTAEAGHSAEYLHDYGELPGLVYAVPYVNLPTAWGFVMEVESTKDVVGYVLGSTDTAYFDKVLKTEWLPPLSGKYREEDMKKPGDIRYAKLLKNMYDPPDANIQLSSVHLHIDILEKYQRKGWGRRLISQALEYLQSEGYEAVWVGTDPRNSEARAFYRKLGFTGINGADENQLGLRFGEFK